jgi:hypothetical protein
MTVRFNEYRIDGAEVVIYAVSKKHAEQILKDSAFTHLKTKTLYMVSYNKPGKKINVPVVDSELKIVSAICENTRARRLRT